MEITINTKINASGIYLIRNLINGKLYIGSAINIYRRIFSTNSAAHLNSLRNKVHYNKKLQNAWNKYGESNFRFEVLEFCEKSNLLKREQYYLDNLLYAKDLTKFSELGYNICPTAGSNLGRKMSQETKNKLSILRLGDKNPMYGKLNKSRSKKLLQYNQSGNFLKLWENANEVCDYYNLSINSIRGSIYKGFSCGNYYWLYYQDNFPTKITINKNVKVVSVEAINIETKEVLKFKSLTEAAKYFNIERVLFSNNVNYNIKGKIEHYKNYKWKKLKT